MNYENKKGHESKKEKTLDNEVIRFSRVLAQDASVKEVSFDKNAISYSINNYKINVTFKTSS